MRSLNEHVMRMQVYENIPKLFFSIYVYIYVYIYPFNVIS